MLLVAFDIGGTFTDLVARDIETGESWFWKTLSTPDEPDRAAVAGLEELLAQDGRSLGDVVAIVHATTVAANALIERKGSRAGLITTEGFRDVLIIGRQKRPETYELTDGRPRPLVQRRAIGEVRERLAPDGSVVTRLDGQTLDAAIDRLLAQGVETVAVSLMHSYANPAHELAVGARLAERAPELSISLSSDVSPKHREYERTSTVVADAFVKPTVNRYLARLTSKLASRGFTRTLLIMQSNGGLAEPELIRRHPIRIVESGPAAGVLMCAELSRQEGEPNLLTFDMGGTTAKLGAIQNGEPAVTRTFEVDPIQGRRGAGLPLNIPAIDLLEIGAGGGSIAGVEMGTIAVGPESAGADPGPVAYGRGGQRATVTDANVVLGYLNPDNFNAGALTLDEQAARQAIDTQLAAPLGLSVEEAAWGVHAVANANMERALRVVSLGRGRDPRSFALVAFGGAGPVHGARLARSLGIPRVLVPLGAGVGSAVGLLAADPRVELSNTRVLRLDADGASATIAALYEQLERDAAQQLGGLASGARIEIKRHAYLRYERQGFELRIAVDREGGDSDLGDVVADAFHAAYRDHYGYAEDRPVVGVDWSLTATVRGAGAAPCRLTSSSPVTERTRRAFFPEVGGHTDCALVWRDEMRDGARVAGPAVIEEAETTVLVPPGDVARVTAHGSIVIEVA